MGELIAVVVAVAGVLLAVLSFWRDFADYRARRYCLGLGTYSEWAVHWDVNLDPSR